MSVYINNTSSATWRIIGIAVLYITLFLLIVYPLFIVRHPPLQDYANHLARMYILKNHDNILLGRYYQVAWNFIPNLLIDITIPILSTVLTLENAGKVYIALVFFLLTSGPIFLHFVLYHKLSIIPLFSFFFIYSMALQKGFLNFLGGCGFAVWGLAIWLLVRNKNSFIYICIGSIISGFLYFSHLHAFGVYAVAVIIYEIKSISWKPQDVWQNKLTPIAMALVQFIPWIIIFLLITAPNSGGKGQWNYGNYAHILRKVNISWIFFSSYQPILDWFSTALVIIGIILVFLRRWFYLSTKIAWGLGALTVLSLVLPGNILGGASGDWRLLIPTVFIASGSVQINRSKNKEPCVMAIIAGILLFIILLRISLVASHWKTDDRFYSDFKKVIQSCEKGTRLFTAAANTIYNSPDQHHSRFAIMHLPAYGVIERQLFIPTIAAYPMQQPIIYTPSVLSVKKEAGFNIFFYGTSKKIPCDFVRREFDYLLLIDENSDSNSEACDLQRINNSGILTLYRVSK